MILWFIKNGYLDDGTYTAVKVIGLLARVSKSRGENGEGDISLLDLISELKEMEEVQELRMNVNDGSIATTNEVFKIFSQLIEGECSSLPSHDWYLDDENLEGVRVRTGEGGFFMLRKSLHDPIISLQIEGPSRNSVLEKVIYPIQSLLNSSEICSLVDASCLYSF